MKLHPFVEKEISDFISKAQLGEETRELWYEIVHCLEPEDVLQLHSALVEKPELVFTLSDNLNAKVKAMKAADGVVLDQILDEEKKLLEAL